MIEIERAGAAAGGLQQQASALATRQQELSSIPAAACPDEATPPSPTAASINPVSATRAIR